MRLDYGVDDHPPWWKNLLFGLQWSALLIPSIITLGRAVDANQVGQTAPDASYLQRLFIVSAITLVVQVYSGHRLPVIAGPAAILLVAVLATGPESQAAVPLSMLCGGVLLTGLAWSGLLRSVRILFTDRVIAVVLLLIAFTLLPTTLRLLIATESGISPRANLTFAFVLILLMFLAQQFLKGAWQSTVIIWAMLIGTGAYAVLFPNAVISDQSLHAPPAIEALTKWHFTFSFQPTVLISFLVCFLAVSINDLSSIQSMNRLLNLQDMDRRVTRGITITGLANVLAGLLGVVGPVNYSLSPGVVMTTALRIALHSAPNRRHDRHPSFFPYRNAVGRDDSLGRHRLHSSLRLGESSCGRILRRLS